MEQRCPRERAGPGIVCCAPSGATPAQGQMQLPNVSLHPKRRPRDSSLVSVPTTAVARAMYIYTYSMRLEGAA